MLAQFDGVLFSWKLGAWDDEEANVVAFGVEHRLIIVVPVQHVTVDIDDAGPVQVIPDGIKERFLGPAPIPVVGIVRFATEHKAAGVIFTADHDALEFAVFVVLAATSRSRFNAERLQPIFRKASFALAENALHSSSRRAGGTSSNAAVKHGHSRQSDSSWSGAGTS